MDTNINFIFRLKSLQGDKSIRAFALHCGIPDSTMRHYLNGKRKPTTDNIEKIANACDRSVGWLVRGESPSIKKLSQDRLKDFFNLDPEVIDLENINGKVIPVVKTYDDEESQLHFFCIHCNIWHHHGRGGVETPYRKGREGFAGDRSAHCIVQNSPFLLNGIILDVIGKFKDGEKLHKEGSTPLCPECHNYYSAAFNACDCGFIDDKKKTKYPELKKLYLKHEELPIISEEPKKLGEEKKTNVQPSSKIAATLNHWKTIEKRDGEQQHEQIDVNLQHIFNWLQEETAKDKRNSLYYFTDLFLKYPEFQEYMRKKMPESKFPGDISGKQNDRIA